MKYTKITAVFMTAVFLVKAPIIFAQVEVVESSPAIRAAGQSQNPFSPKPKKEEQNIQAEMYYQLQTLQQEIATLRGQLEEQSYELKRLKQQRLDDYTDLDGRISGLSNSGLSNSRQSNGGSTTTSSRPATSVSSRSSSGPSQSTATSSRQNPNRSSGSASDPDEFAGYNGAMDLIRAKQYDQAIESFNALLGKYPQGQYSANSYHWLGQLYQLRNSPEKARDAYGKVVSDFPSHSKASDAKLKLGQLLFQLGDKPKSKALLQEVAASDASESRLAKNFLQENFPQ